MSSERKRNETDSESTDEPDAERLEITDDLDRVEIGERQAAKRQLGVSS